LFPTPLETLGAPFESTQFELQNSNSKKKMKKKKDNLDWMTHLPP
jgi:hypothetical protein